MYFSLIIRSKTLLLGIWAFVLLSKKEPIIEEPTSGRGYALRMTDYWREIKVQQPQSHGRFAPEIKVQGGIAVVEIPFTNWICCRAFENSLL